LPFTSKNITTNMQGGNTTYTNRGTWAMPLVTSNATTVAFHNLDGTNATNVSFSTRILRFAVYYSV
jgi:hypothetical protein